MMNMHIKITEEMHIRLKNHLHCGDGLEAVAFALCGRHRIEGSNFLLVHKLCLIPYSCCVRAVDRVSWNTDLVEDILFEASQKDMGIIKFHSHFVEDSDFSNLDNNSDKSFFESVFAWTETAMPHVSAIMYPSGKFKGRVIDSGLEFNCVSRFSIIGNNLSYHVNEVTCIDISDAFQRNSQTFGLGTTRILNKLKIGIIGCSGTGSPLIEQLVRLGVGELVLIDNDYIGVENLNRIVGSTLDDAVNKRFKVDVIKEHIEEIGLNTKVTVYKDLFQTSLSAIDELASCDFLFGCMDSIEGRHCLNLLSTYYLIPLIDIGIKLVADGLGGIDSITGNIHYVYPGSNTLLERRVYSSDQLASESLKRIAPKEYENRAAYFENASVSSPAVISVNTLCSSLAANDFLARINPYRYISNSIKSTVLNLCNWEITNQDGGVTSEKLHLSNIGIGKLGPNLRSHV